jgi:peroxiredoxin Q/BCP
MRLNAGTLAPRIQLPCIDGSVFDTESLRGHRYLLGFFRFAGCPFCNMRLHGLVKRFASYPEDFTVVAVFDSPLENLALHTRRHNAPFPILADESNHYYRAYGIERSLMGVAKAITTRVPTLIKATLKGYIPIRVKGSMTTMPADFLVDAEGIIQLAYYGRDEGDHLPFADVEKFANRVSPHHSS